MERDPRGTTGGPRSVGQGLTEPRLLPLARRSDAVGEGQTSVLVKSGSGAGGWSDPHETSPALFGRDGSRSRSAGQVCRCGVTIEVLAASIPLRGG